MHQFFHCMLPRMEIEDEHIVKLVELKKETADTENLFRQKLQDGIEILLRCKTIRDYARQ